MRPYGERVNSDTTHNNNSSVFGFSHSKGHIAIKLVEQFLIDCQKTMCCNFLHFLYKISNCSSSAKTNKFLCAWTLWVSVNQEKNQTKRKYGVWDRLTESYI